MFRWSQNGRSRWTEPQTFLVNNLSFPQPRRKQGGRCAFKRVLNTDSGFKAAAWTLENKNGNVNISSKLNSAFNTIGKATADKITAKLVGKTHAFAFAWIINHRTRVDFLCSKISFFASSWMKIYYYWTSCHVSFIWLPSFDSFSARWIWVSVHLI